MAAAPSGAASGALRPFEPRVWQAESMSKVHMLTYMKLSLLYTCLAAARPRLTQSGPFTQLRGIVKGPF